MPSFVTHHYFALRVRQSLPSALAHICESFPAAYSWGSQGPDPFFFALFPPGNPLPRLGMKMHRESIRPVFQKMAETVGSSAAGLSYLFGFCTHYALDRSVHPYIEDQTRLLMARYDLSNAAAHKLCEADIDAAVLLAHGVRSPAKEPAYQLLDVHSPDGLPAARLLAAAGNAAGGSVTIRQAENAFRSIYEVYRLLHEGKAARKILISGENALQQHGAISAMIRKDRPLPEDSLNRAHRVWLDWDGRLRKEDFCTLAEEAALPFALTLQRAVCAACRQGCVLPEELFQLDYSGRSLAPGKC